ncbi:uncharacterized protein LOC113211561 [Frankliniella occidentalis]|uniref:Uncharacterized protein LOC113211561 n=1 Tax=Frankliniella occidentalis TaxID=133901 RepID=A0A9C6XSX2_FRAOC|nr:uncharacterized protein LOC113211561 [Frankliniella occidentalis]
MSARRAQDPRARPRARPRKTFDDLPDKVLLRVLRELPQPDLLQVSRVSSRLHDLSRDGALWRDLGTLGPDLPTEDACSLLRNAPNLTALRLHGRHDADAILLEASRFCRGLELLELTQCRGSQSFRQLAYLPLVKVAQNCRSLRRVYFWETDFMCSRVFKVWADLRGPDDPVLEIGVNSLTRRQANYMTSVLGGPAELHMHALQATPFVLHVHGHALSLAEDLNSEEALLAAPSTSAAVPAGGAPSSARVRAAPSSSSTGGEGTPKRARLDEDPVAVTTVYMRQPPSPQSSASTSTGEQGALRSHARRLYAFDHVNVGGDDSSGDSDTDNMDVVVASPPMSVEPPDHADEEADDDAENIVIAPSRSRPAGRLEYKSVFGMGCTSEPLVNSWFRSGYMPDCDDQDHREPEQSQSGLGALRTALLPLPRGDNDGSEDDSEDERTVTVTLEVAAVAGEADAMLGERLLPPAAARLADSLKEPADPQPGGDLQPDPVAKRAPPVVTPPHGQHSPIDGDHAHDDAPKRADPNDAQ